MNSNDVIACLAARHRSGTRERRTYRAWQILRQRCTNHHNHDFVHYGGVGITCCSAWSSFSQFFQDVGLAPTALHTIDRKDSTKGYTPDNVRWATRAEQQSNLKSNRRLLKHRNIGMQYIHSRFLLTAFSSFVFRLCSPEHNPWRLSVGQNSFSYHSPNSYNVLGCFPIGAI